MADVKHTPGPWKVFFVKKGPNKGQLIGVGKMTGEGVADAYGGLWGSGGEKLANALLIAAAPTLLEAAKSARDVLLATHPVDRTRDEQKALDDLTAAIALAKGEKVDG